MTRTLRQFVWLILFSLSLAAPCAARTMVVVLLPGTSLADWERADAPNLHRLMREGSVAIMNTRTARRPSDRVRETPASGALTLAAGARAAGGPEALGFPRADRTIPGTGGTAGTLYARRMGSRPATGSRVNVEWPRLLRENARQGYDVHLGNLADGLLGAGVSIKAMGGPLAFVVAANGGGMIASPPARPGRDTCVFWDAGSDIAAADQALGRWMARLIAGQVIAVSPSAGDSAYQRGERLCPVATWPTSPGLIFSPSTRRAGLVTNTDFAPTVAAYFGARLPMTPFGRPWEYRGAVNGAAQVRALNAAAVQQAHAIGVLPYVAVFLGIWILGATLLPWSHRLRRGSALLPAILVPSLIVSRSGPELTAWLCVMLVTLALARRPGVRRLMTGLTAVTVLLLVCDMLRHDPLMRFGILGYSAVEGARYYGIGNEAMGPLIGACLVLADFLWLASNLRVRGVIVAGLLLVTSLLGSPLAGAKAGGLMVALVSFGTYVWLRSGRRWHGRAAGVAILSSIAVLLAVAFLDARQGVGLQSHFGQAVERLLYGGSQEWSDIVIRKLVVEGRLLYHSAWAIPLWGGLASLLWMAPEQNPADKPLLTAGSVAVVACLVLNDAGTVAASLCLALVWGRLLVGSKEKARRLIVKAAG